MSQLEVLSDAQRKKLGQTYKEFKAAPKYDLNSEELFCTCRAPDDGRLMVCCDGCDEWFHFKCVRLNSTYKDLVNNYFCEFCDVLFHKGKTLWKKKCMLPGCYKPVRIEVNEADPEKKVVSKYCSDEHGLKFINNLLTEKFTDKQSENNDKSQGTLTISEISMALNRTQALPDLKKLGETGMPQFSEFYKEKTSKDFVIPQETQERIDKNSNEAKLLSDELKIFNRKLTYLTRLKEKIKLYNDQMQKNEEFRQAKKDAKDELEPDAQAEADNDTPMDGSSAAKPKKKSAKNKKKKKTKKIDICGFDPNLRLDHSDWLVFEACDDYKTLTRDDIEFIKTLEDLRINEETFQAQYTSLKAQQDSEEAEAEDEENDETEANKINKEDQMDVDDDEFDVDESYFKDICLKDKRKCNKHSAWYNIFNDRFQFKIDDLSYEIKELATKREDLLVDLNLRLWEAYQLGEFAL